MGTKRIEIEELDGLRFRIVKQTHRGEEFGRGYAVFRASNGFTLESSKTLEAKPCKTLYVRGSVTDSDDDILRAPSEEWMRQLREAVREYNSTFGGTCTTALAIVAGAASACAAALLLRAALSRQRERAGDGGAARDGAAGG